MTAKKSVDYHVIRQELDAVISELQEPDVTIDQAIELHKQATKLVGQLETQLAEARTVITRLTKPVE